MYTALQIIGANITQKLSKENIGRAFTALGFDSRRTNKMRGYVVVRRSAEEMRSMRYQLAAPSVSDSDSGDSIFWKSFAYLCVCVQVRVDF